MIDCELCIALAQSDWERYRYSVVERDERTVTLSSGPITFVAVVRHVVNVEDTQDSDGRALFGAMRVAAFAASASGEAPVDVQSDSGRNAAREVEHFYFRIAPS